MTGNGMGARGRGDRDGTDVPGADRGTPPGGATRDSRRTKEAILRAASTEFADRGYDGARVDGIAARAGVNKALLYRHFGDKHQLHASVLRHVDETLRTAMTALAPAGPDPVDDIVELARFAWRHHVAHPDHAGIVTGLRATEWIERTERSGEHPILARISSSIETGRRTGAIGMDVDPVLTFASVVSSCIIHRAHLGALSALSGRDLGTDDEMDAWEEHVVRTTLSSLRVHRRIGRDFPDRE